MLDDQELKRELSQETGSVYYGDGGTIGASYILQIEVDKDGSPTAVWFRCMTLPFEVYRRGDGDSPCFANPDVEIIGIDYRRK